MKALLTTALLALAVLLPFQAKAADTCDTPSAPRVEFRLVDAHKVTVVNTKSARELNRISKGFSTGNSLLGVTAATFGSRLVVEHDSCGSPVAVVELHLVEQTVYVASGIPSDSCTYRETLAHEYQHVAINSDYLKRVQDSLQASFDVSRYRSEPVLVKAVSDDLIPRAAQMYGDSRRLHIDFDHEDKDADRSAACRQELALYH